MLLETLKHSFLSVYYNWVYIAAIIIHVAPLESTVVFFLTCSYHVVLCIHCSLSNDVDKDIMIYPTEDRRTAWSFIDTRVEENG